MMSLTSTRPFGSGRTAETAPSESLVTAVTGPICLMGGSDCATHTELTPAASASTVRPIAFFMTALQCADVGFYLADQLRIMIT
jgi:hypothetical protein